MTREQLNDPQEWSAIMAFKAGKPIQKKVKWIWVGDEQNKWIEWVDDPDPEFDGTRKHRVKDMPVPPGILTYDEAVKMVLGGVPLEVWLPDVERWATSVANSGKSWWELSREEAYRRAPAPTAPVRVPLGPEDVNPGSVFRMIGEVGWAINVQVGRGGVIFIRKSGAVEIWDWMTVMD